MWHPNDFAEAELLKGFRHFVGKIGFKQDWNPLLEALGQRLQRWNVKVIRMLVRDPKIVDGLEIAFADVSGNKQRPRVIEGFAVKPGITEDAYASDRDNDTGVAYQFVKIRVPHHARPKNGTFQKKLI